MTRLAPFIKYNPVTVSIYHTLLERRCKTVRAYVFVATTGRSGSESLSNIFEAVDGAISLHEPYPVMYNDYPPHIDRRKYFNELFHKAKRINIKRYAAGHLYYVETNHQFVKNFISQAVECFGKKIKIIHLIRDPVRVASSLYSINSIPGKTTSGKCYLLDPNDDDNLINIRDLLYSRSEFRADLYKCLWYWYEVEARITMMKQRYHDVSWYTLRTEDLNEKNALLKMFDQLELPVNPSELEALVGVRANKRLGKRTRNVDLLHCEAMNRELLHAIEDRHGNTVWL